MKAARKTNGCHDEAAAALVRLVPRRRSARRRVPTLIDVTPQPSERAAIASPPGGALLVLGEAGHGKTTVLVQRVAHLYRASRGHLRAAVVVPTDGLVRLLDPLFRRAGVDVAVRTYDAWAAAQARRSFRWLPRESELTPPAVMRLKRHPALRLALAELAEREPGRIDDDVDAPVRKTRRHVSRGDLQHLFGSGILMDQVARVGAMPASCVESVLERTKLQVGPSAEQEHWYVTDTTRLRAVDGRPLDEGTATAHAGTVDVEDYAVLFELDRLRAERQGKPATSPARFDLLAVDEAQELAPLELALLGRSVVPGGTLVVSGDADQQTDATTTFPGWEGVMRELGKSDHDVLHLRIGYRCPPHVEELARAVRDGRPARIDPSEPSRGARTVLRAFPSERALAAELGTAMDQILRRDRRASLAVICRSLRTAQRLAPLLRAHTSLRLVLDGRFLPRGAAQASTVDEVKGLEFDYVIVPDADATHYPDDPPSRRALYVAITRARHQVLLAHTGEQTPLIQTSALRPPQP